MRLARDAPYRITPHERWKMKTALAIALIVGFLLVDFLFFHDIMKPGEVITFPQYLTGLLSIPVILGRRDVCTPRRRDARASSLTSPAT